MTKALVNALAMALALDPDLGVPLPQALAFAEGFVESNQELLAVPSVIVDMEGRALGPQPIVAVPAIVPARAPKAQPSGVTHDTKEAAYGTFTPVVGADGLTDKQRQAVGNVGLCPNCQQPNSDHLPGCARASGEDPRAVTKRALPPAI